MGDRGASRRADALALAEQLRSQPLAGEFALQFPEAAVQMPPRFAGMPPILFSASVLGGQGCEAGAAKRPPMVAT